MLSMNTKIDIKPIIQVFIRYMLNHAIRTCIKLIIPNKEIQCNIQFNQISLVDLSSAKKTFLFPKPKGLAFGHLNALYRTCRQTKKNKAKNTFQRIEDYIFA